MIRNLSKFPVLFGNFIDKTRKCKYFLIKKRLNMIF
jgi:hypothetical protein